MITVMVHFLKNEFMVKVELLWQKQYKLCNGLNYGIKMDLNFNSRFNSYNFVII